MDYSKIITLANKIKFEDIFSDELTVYLDSLCKQSNTSTEFLICPLITCISHLLNHAEIHALQTLREGMSVYSVLLADPATGKSQSMSLVKNALVQIEGYLGVTAENSRLVNAATVESLVFYLEKFKSIISFWDEASMFMGSFGRYSGSGNVAVSYDRSIYLEIANAGSMFSRDLKASRCRITSPRLNIALLGHPRQFIDVCHNETTSSDDGLIHRFYLCSPKPPIITSMEINTITKLDCSLRVVLFFIYKLNCEEKNNVYTLNDEAKRIYNDYFDQNRELVFKSNSTHKTTFISAMLGKGPTQLLRLSAIMQSIHDSYQYVSQISEEKKILSQRLDTDIQNYLQSNPCKVISEKNVVRAFKMIEYFNKNKLVLSGYDIDINTSINDCFADIINKSFNMKKPKTIEQKIASVILLDPMRIVNLNSINQKISMSTIKIKNIEAVCEKLQALNLGIIKIEKRAGSAYKNFEKSIIKHFDFDMIEKLQEFQIDIEDFKTINSNYLEKPVQNKELNPSKHKQNSSNNISNINNKKKHKQAANNISEIENQVNYSPENQIGNQTKDDKNNPEDKSVLDNDNSNDPSESVTSKNAGETRDETNF